MDGSFDASLTISLHCHRRSYSSANAKLLWYRRRLSFKSILIRFSAILIFFIIFVKVKRKQTLFFRILCLFGCCLHSDRVVLHIQAAEHEMKNYIQKKMNMNTNNNHHHFRCRCPVCFFIVAILWNAICQHMCTREWASKHERIIYSNENASWCFYLKQKKSFFLWRIQTHHIFCVG